MRRQLVYLCALFVLVLALAAGPVGVTAEEVTPTPTATPTATATATPTSTPTITPTATYQVPQSNDYFAYAREVNGLPFSAVASTGTYTTEMGEPIPFCSYNYAVYNTAWYKFTPSADVRIVANTNGSANYDRVMAVYRDGGFGISGLIAQNCVTYSGTIDFVASAGTTYYFQTGYMYPYYYGSLAFNVEAVTPPANDNFANAVTVESLPASVTADARYATNEPGERTCTSYYSAGSVWFKFTPSETQSLMARASSSYGHVLGVWTGNSVADLSQIGFCRWYGSAQTFVAEAGTTYYFQLAIDYGYNGSVGLSVDVTPPPTASMSFWPGSPTMFDTVTFQNYSYDPANVGGWTCAWDFGDRTGSTDCYSSHRFAEDGEYPVTLTATTSDGRSASTTQTVIVKTHDVAITKFTVPQSASAGQTKHIVVGLNSKRYAETVQVQILKGNPGTGWNSYQVVGTLTQYVPARQANRTTDFDFSYTFTPDDALAGKVTFKAVATMQSAADLFPADNEAVSSPVKISR